MRLFICKFDLYLSNPSRLYVSLVSSPEIESRIQAPLEMRCYKRLLNISYKDRVTNEEVRNRIQNVNGVHYDLNMVKKRKLRWYDHISRSSGMAKTILQGTVKGTRRRDRRRDDKIASRNGQEWGVWRFPVGREW